MELKRLMSSSERKKYTTSLVENPNRFVNTVHHVSVKYNQGNKVTDISIDFTKFKGSIIVYYTCMLFLNSFH